VSFAGGLRTLWRRTLAFEQLGLLIALLVLLGAVDAFRPTFLSRVSLANLAQGASLYGIMALGMVFLLAMREIDLSVGSLYGLTAMVAALLITKQGWDPWLAALAALALATLLGLVNGLIANLLRIPTIIVTLGTLSIYAGITLVLANNQYVAEIPPSSFFRIVGGEFLGMPAPAWIFLFAAIVLQVIFSRSRFGFVIRAVGSNPVAAVLSGIRVDRVRLIAMSLMGFLAGLAGLVTFGFLQNADPTLGQGYELLVIAAAVIGGTGLFGGSGSVLGALIGAALISTIQGALVQFGVNPNWTQLVTGAVIIGAVSLDTLLRTVRVRRQAAAEEALAVDVLSTSTQLEGDGSGN
jgi:ribose transport system permease protein